MLIFSNKLMEFMICGFFVYFLEKAINNCCNKNTHVKVSQRKLIKLTEGGEYPHKVAKKEVISLFHNFKLELINIIFEYSQKNVVFFLLSSQQLFFIFTSTVQLFKPYIWNRIFFLLSASSNLILLTANFNNFPK
jgi:hypothetical protein